ncbi:hypothetical protein JFN87_11800 [Streptomyces bomunensis]|uniref:Uncharacterized protein n=1 Tax=Streptomyces montanisoli TaxID=2798581 RepID=A0A940MBD8_9ACTN|nr:hypothetical protein [Streptomyces montanisoli]
MPQGIKLDIPFESRVSPDLARARREHLAWPRLHGLIPDSAASQRHLMGSYAEVAARFHPSATGDDLDLGVDQQSWFFLFDDFFDGPVGRDPKAVRGLVRDVASAFRGSDVPQHPLARAFADLWARSTMGMSGSWRARAAADWRAYLNGYVDEASARRQR